jgi:hypothetical protein
MDDLKVSRNHNVYILGAGFSHDAGMPLISDFFVRMRESLDWLEDEARHEERRAIEEVLRFRLQASAAAYRAVINLENIEDLFSLASASQGNSLALQVTTAIAATLDYSLAIALPSIFELKMYDKSLIKPCPLWEPKAGCVDNDKEGIYNIPSYHLYAGLLSGLFCEPKPRMCNTIISFNYDTVLEDALTDLGIRFDYGLPAASTKYHSSAEHIHEAQAKDPLKVLKLHGSVNWSPAVKKNNKASVTVFRSYDELRRNKGQVVLIPPTWRKTFGGSLEHVWEAALQALTQATRIVVIGFLMPPTDMHFKFLLAEGLRNNISLRQILFVNKDPEPLEKNVLSILRPELKQQGIVGIKPKETRYFFSDKMLMAAIDRHYSRGIGDVAPY